MHGNVREGAVSQGRTGVLLTVHSTFRLLSLLDWLCKCLFMSSDSICRRHLESRSTVALREWGKLVSTTYRRGAPLTHSADL